jgi:hypothetical protein
MIHTQHRFPVIYHKDFESENLLDEIYNHHVSRAPGRSSALLGMRRTQYAFSGEVNLKKRSPFGERFAVPTLIHLLQKSVWSVRPTFTNQECCSMHGMAVSGKPQCGIGARSECRLRAVIVLRPSMTKGSPITKTRSIANELN